ncbi:MAG: hypothetical protein ABUS57_17655 [Pseudomonadota bacterium]
MKFSWVVAALAVPVVLYAGVVTLYLLGFEAGALRQPAALGGFVLAGAIPLFLRDQHWRARAVLMVTTLVGAGLVQVADARMNQRAGQAASLAALHAQIQTCEAQRNESDVGLNLRDAVAGVRNADKGLLLKADRLALRATFLDARARALDLSPEDRGRAAKMLVAVKASEAAYRAASADFVANVAPVYERLLTNLDATDVDFATALDGVDAHLNLMLESQPTAGVLNHLGVLAMDRAATDPTQRNKALAYFYRGLALDPDHVPLYESVGYAAWAITGDQTSRMRYALEGLGLAKREKAAAAAEFAEAKRRLYPESADAVEKRFAGVVDRWSKMMDGMQERLALQHSYYVALKGDPADGKIARAEAAALHAQAPDDAEYADNLGFVLLRFAATTDDLVEAKALFRQAQSAVRAESTTKAIARAHLLEADALLSHLEGEDISAKLGTLRRGCV